MERRNMLLAALAAPLAFFTGRRSQASPARKDIFTPPGAISSRQMALLYDVVKINALMRRLLKDDPEELKKALREYVEVRYRERGIVSPPWVTPDPRGELFCTAGGLPVYTDDFDDEDSLVDYRETIFRRSPHWIPDERLITTIEDCHPVHLVRRDKPPRTDPVDWLRTTVTVPHVAVEPCMLRRIKGYVCELVYLDGTRAEEGIDELRHRVVDHLPLAWVRDEEQFEILFKGYTDRRFEYAVAQAFHKLHDA